MTLSPVHVAGRGRRPFPLVLALPNGPAHYIGRRDEAAWLAAAVDRGHVCVVWGLGGLGKSALALHVLNERASRQPTLRIGLRAGITDLRAHLIRALASAMGFSDQAGGDFQRDQSDALLIDLAETLGCCVLLDDLHVCDADQARMVLSLLAAHCHRARFVVTSRMDPGLPELMGLVRQLDAMQEEDITSLAASLMPHLPPSVRGAAVANAGGSPWRLLQCLAGVLESHQEEDWTSEEPRVVRTLRTLAVLREELPLEVALALLPGMTRDDLRNLARRAYLESGTFGVRLHDATRPVIVARMSRQLTRDVSLQVARQLGALDDVSANLEALRLLITAEESQAARELLERQGANLISAGRARAVDAILRDVRGFEDWQLRVAVEIGDAAHRALATPPAEPWDAETALAWARALFLRGKLREGQAVSSAILANPAAPNHVAFETGLHLARLAVYSGRHVDAATLLQRMPVFDEPQRLRRDALLASCLAYCSRFEEAHAIAVGCIPTLGALPPATLVATAGPLVRALVMAGRPFDAERVVATVPEPTRAVTRALHAGLNFATACVELAIDRGQFAEARRILDALGPGNLDYVEGVSLFCRWLTLRVWIGELATAEADLERLDRSACLAASPLPGLWGLWVRMQIRLLRGERTDGLEGPLERARDCHVLQHWAPLVAAELTVRRGAHADFVNPEGERLRASRALMAGDLESARSIVRRGIDDARSLGRGATELELLAFACDLAIFHGDLAELLTHARALGELAERCGSPRFEREAAFFLWFSTPAAGAGELEDLAMVADVAPTASRRAQALLGGSPRLDVLDRRVVEAKLARGWRLPEHPAPTAPGWSAGWGIEQATQCVWFAGGATVDLSRHPVLWRLLSALVDSGGTATKEELVQSVWDVAFYHPLRHDNRLRVTIRKLRQQLGDDERARPCIRTTEDGYALVGTVRVFGSPGAAMSESGIVTRVSAPASRLAK